MKEILRFWRDKPLQEKKQIMQSKSITVITYSDIKMIYESENNLKNKT